MSKDKNANSNDNKPSDDQALPVTPQAGDAKGSAESMSKQQHKQQDAQKKPLTGSRKSADGAKPQTASKAGKDKVNKEKAGNKPAVKKSPNKPLSNNTSKPRVPPNKKGRGLLWLMVVIIIAAAGYVGWRYLDGWLQQGRETNSTLRDQLESQQRLMTQLQSQVESQVAVQDKQQAAQNALINQLQLRLNSQASRLQDLATATRDDWLLAEAEYLLRLANQRLLTERTTENPQALLLSADEILKEFADPDLFAVRKQIAEEVTALRLTSLLDREGVYLQLVALAGVIPQLQLLIEPWSDEQEPVVEQEPAAEQLSWGARLWQNTVGFFGGLDNYIRINDRSAPTEPLLSPDEESYLRHNMAIMLEQAQLALLREEGEIYRTSLQKSSHWLSRYFELNPQAKLFQQQLDELSRQPIDQGLPDISASLDGLRAYINLWHLRHPVPSKQGDQQPAVEGKEPAA